MSHSPSVKAGWQMALAATLWSIAGIFIKQIDSNPFAICGMRSLIAAVTVLLYLAIRRQRIVVNRRVLLGAVWLCATFFSFVIANKMTTAANAIILQFTSPVFIMLFSALFLHQRVRRVDMIVVAVTLGGIALFFLDQLDSGHLIGNLFGILSGVFMAAMFLSLGSDGQEEKMSSVLFGQLLAAVIGIPFCFLLPCHFDGTAFACLAVLGVVQLGIPYILVALAAGQCSPLACSLIGVIEPLLNPVWVAIFNGEMPGAWAFVGGFIVIAAVTGWCVYNGRHTPAVQ